MFRLNLSVLASPFFLYVQYSGSSLVGGLRSRPPATLAAGRMVQPDLIERRHLWGKANSTMATSILTYVVLSNRSILALSGVASL